METHADTTADQLANLINESVDAMIDLDRQLNELHEQVAKLETLKANLSRDIQRAQAALDRTEVEEITAEIREEQPVHEQDDDEPARFEIGATYSYRLATDAHTRYPVKVVGRTPKFVTIEERGDQWRCKIHHSDRGEYVMPHGRYSMAPMLSAASCW